MKGKKKQSYVKQELTDKKISDKPKGEANSMSLATEQIENTWNKQSQIWFSVVSTIAVLTKFYGLETPHETVFDEVHFGKFASYYIKREYFFDVHPPLGKLLFAAVGYLAGYDGWFNFEKIGLSYLDTDVPYVDMRLLSAACGALTVTVVYSMLVEMRFSLPVAVLGTIMVAFDNALTTQSRFILLDAQLIFFTVTACFCWVKFRSHTNSPFTLKWWLWLLGTGLFIGLTLGVKLIGLFVTATIGICTILDLWDVTSIKKTKKDITVAYHWLARALCLILIPIALFLIPYWVHFKIANNSGQGDSYMSNAFQSTLNGSKVIESTVPVYYGSVIKIVNKAEKVYLHSHKHNYPLKHQDGKVSSQGQQVTGYSHPDENNDWIILPETTDPPIDYIENPKIIVTDGDLVQLKHVTTGMYLMTHNVASPLTLTNQEVTCIDAENATNQKYPETLWKIQIMKGGDELYSKVNMFRLMHNASKTNLLNQKQSLPEWGFKQREINAGRVEDQKSWWFVDNVTMQNGTTDNDQIQSEILYQDKLTFWEKFLELITVSATHNSKLVDNGPYLTTPIQWPFLIRGTSFWVSKDRTERVYLLGNPLTWYVSILSLPIFITLIIIDQLVQLRGAMFLSLEQKKFMYPKGLFFLLCYLLHYLPFFVMGRVLYFHHYLPCYLLNTLIFTTLYQAMALRYRIMNNKAVVGVICSLIAGVFFHFSSLTYATNHSEEYFNSLRWISTWHF